MKHASLIVAGCLTLAPAYGAKTFQVHGHRGARWSRPENTLSAFKFALAAGVDALEMDLHVTRDNILVVTHDPELNPSLCLDSTGKRISSGLLVREMTLKTLKTYDCGTLVNPRFPTQTAQPKETIPTFEEVLDWLDHDPDPRARTVQLNVETKSELDHPEYTPEPAVFTKMVLDAFKKHQLGNRAILQSFDYRTLIEARKLDPTLTLSALVEDKPRRGELVELARRLHASIVSPNEQWLTQKQVDELHAIQVKVVPWTSNTEESWNRLSGFGVDAIITDNPKGLLEFRAK